jgi:hypothetical protein
MNCYKLLLVIIIIFLPILFIFKKNTKIDFITKGIEFHNNDKIFLKNIHQKILKKLENYNNIIFINKINDSLPFISYKMNDEFLKLYSPNYDTLRLNKRLELDPEKDLEKEIIYSMLLSPEPFIYPSYEEFESAVNIRINIVKNSKNAFLKFNCTENNRPKKYWKLNKNKEWILKKDKSLIDAIRKTIIQNNSNPYSFSCYRATEYIILLSLIEELYKINKPLYDKIENIFRIKTIKSGKFHEIFLDDHGNDNNPLPIFYFIPGDRVWFKNPDYKSSDILGYEGSWMIYLGNNKFKNFWQKENDFSLEDKLIEVYTYSICTYKDKNGNLQINDEMTYQKLEEIKKDKERYNKILSKYMRYRDPIRVYKNGGSIDRTSEKIKLVHPSTSNIFI